VSPTSLHLGLRHEYRRHLIREESEMITLRKRVRSANSRDWRIMKPCPLEVPAPVVELGQIFTVFGALLQGPRAFCYTLSSQTGFSLNLQSVPRIAGSCVVSPVEISSRLLSLSLRAGTNDGTRPAIELDAV
jgi:hypothetical protein